MFWPTEFAIMRSSMPCGARPDHPARPADATSLEGFWAHRGFTQAQGLSCTMRWKEIGAPGEVTNTLDAWVKTLKGTPIFPSAQP